MSNYNDPSENTSEKATNAAKKVTKKGAKVAAKLTKKAVKAGLKLGLSALKSILVPVLIILGVVALGVLGATIILELPSALGDKTDYEEVVDNPYSDVGAEKDITLANDDEDEDEEENEEENKDEENDEEESEEENEENEEETDEKEGEEESDDEEDERTSSDKNKIERFKVNNSNITFDRVTEVRGVNKDIETFFKMLVERGYWVINPENKEFDKPLREENLPPHERIVKRQLPELLTPEQFEELDYPKDHFNREELFSLNNHVLHAVNKYFWKGKFVYPEHFLQAVPFQLFEDPDNEREYLLKLTTNMVEELTEEEIEQAKIAESDKKKKFQLFTSEDKTKEEKIPQDELEELEKEYHDKDDLRYNVYSRFYNSKRWTFHDKQVAGTWDYGLTPVYKYMEGEVDRWIKAKNIKKDVFNEETGEIEQVDLDGKEEIIYMEDYPQKVMLLDQISTMVGDYIYTYKEDEAEIADLSEGEGEKHENVTKIPYDTVETFEIKEKKVKGKDGKEEVKEEKVSTGEQTLYIYREGVIMEGGMFPLTEEPLNYIEYRYRKDNDIPEGITEPMGEIDYKSMLSGTIERPDPPQEDKEEEEVVECKDDDEECKKLKKEYEALDCKDDDEECEKKKKELKEKLGDNIKLVKKEDDDKDDKEKKDKGKKDKDDKEKKDKDKKNKKDKEKKDKKSDNKGNTQEQASHHTIPDFLIKDVYAKEKDKKKEKEEDKEESDEEEESEEEDENEEERYEITCDDDDEECEGLKKEFEDLECDDDDEECEEKKEELIEKLGGNIKKVTSSDNSTGESYVTKDGDVNIIDLDKRDADLEEERNELREGLTEEQQEEIDEMIEQHAKEFLSSYAVYFEAWIPDIINDFNLKARLKSLNLSGGGGGITSGFDVADFKVGTHLESTNFRRAMEHFPMIEKYANEFSVDPYLLVAQAAQESGGTGATSGGLFQITWAIGTTLTVEAKDASGKVQKVSITDRKDIEANIRYAAARQKMYEDELNDPLRAIQVHNFNPVGYFKDNNLMHIWEDKDKTYEWTKYMDKARERAAKREGYAKSYGANYYCMPDQEPKVKEGIMYGDPCYIHNVLRYYDIESAKRDNYYKGSGGSSASSGGSSSSSSSSDSSSGGSSSDESKDDNDDSTEGGTTESGSSAELEEKAYGYVFTPPNLGIPGLDEAVDERRDSDEQQEGGSRSFKIDKYGYIPEQKLPAKPSFMLDKKTGKEILFVNKLYPVPSTFEGASKDAGEHNSASAASKAAGELRKAAKKEGVTVTELSQYRSVSYQKDNLERSIKDNGEEHAYKYITKPGYSEHHTGLAVDFGNGDDSYNVQTAFETTASGKWLFENAHKYGFVLRYPKGKEGITGINYEPWHYRYVGKEVAQKMYEEGGNNITLEEYLGISDFVTQDEYDASAVGIQVEDGLMGKGEDTSFGAKLKEFFGGKARKVNIKEEFQRFYYTAEYQYDDFETALQIAESERSRLPLSLIGEYTLEDLIKSDGLNDTHQSDGITDLRDTEFSAENGAQGFGYGPKTPKYFGSNELTAAERQAIIDLGLHRPSKVGHITSHYAPSRTIDGITRPHAGSDLGLPKNTPLYAIHDGVIVSYNASCDPYNGYFSPSTGGGCIVNGSPMGLGNFVQYEIAGGYTIIYGHMSILHPDIKVGARFKRGQLLGYSGNSGNTTGPHLHMELRRPNGQYTNPTFIYDAPTN